ncbi:protein spinster homolog 2 isoform X1 [Panthera tigris]|uniref:protein spinster homolog 2 isoform X1 n=1 Tax=Panthera tigris TaxID=9694 RepID=UPI001C6F93C5|nr:protein spinster homolog 2 isoform X1 [Panthera tigris]
MERNSLRPGLGSRGWGRASPGSSCRRGWCLGMRAARVSSSTRKGPGPWRLCSPTRSLSWGFMAARAPGPQAPASIPESVRLSFHVFVRPVVSSLSFRPLPPRPSWGLAPGETGTAPWALGPHLPDLLLPYQVSPIVGMITGTLILILVPATKRGHADQLGGQLKVRTSWLRDMKALIRNRSYVFSSLATSAVSFATGALGMWIPLYLHRAQVVQKTADSCSSPPCGAKDSLIFGAITCFTGFLGVVTGAGATRWCRLRTQRADPLVCAVGMLGSAIFVCLIFVAAKSSIVGAYVCIFVGETLLFSNWAITADILMYVVIPTRRATAVALQSFTSHLLGDAGSPYLIGFISDLIRQSTKDSPLWEFLSLGYALMLCPFVVVLGGMFFLATALFFLGDRAKAEQQALPPSPGADEVPARHVRPAGPRDAMRQSSARARPQLIRHLDPRPSLPQGEPAGDATRTRQSLRPCPQDGEETVPSPYLGGVPGHPGPAGLTRSFLCDPRLGTHPLWCGPAEWPWHQEAASSTDVEGCVWGSRTDGQTPSRWGPGRTQPPARLWGEPGASPPYMVLGGWTLPRGSFGDPGLHGEGAAQASGRSFRL